MATYGTLAFLGNVELNNKSLSVGDIYIDLNAASYLYAQPFYVGQFREGGYVVYVTGSFPNQSVLIAAGVQSDLTWGCSGTNVTTYTTMFSGSLNTTNILAACAETPIGATYCDSLDSNGFTDWYLPSKDELAQIYTNKIYVPGIISSSGAYYMSSTQGNSSTSYWTQDFNNGATYDYRTKTANAYVRPVRKIIP